MASVATQPTSAVSSVPASHLPTPPELEATLSMLSAHRSVLGYILLSRPHNEHRTTTIAASSNARVEEGAAIIRHSGVIFEGEQGRKYAKAIARIVESVREGLDDVGGEDEIRFMRIRTKRHEIMISPDERYLLAVLHDPTT
ncbi:hypothetical protein PUNSTDRAFT_102204 [Punctularia strigosozonata HHB-11173 SS5]|uniref:uncharacterized protein n=1 Tax=Punctularia strigosozonata (strain HHB-11173) TaxID=741275 RepID=UPI0004416ECE|nr:uncharacterized protein PUNSTDRAFT_102204 [Punctularia strigosozonata HHB-11173 SS5]EIN08734.1 hypothetical protein PUNSTDRAFT_102204 [Punctularia strigosozonata HHB-11173 SS5]